MKALRRELGACLAGRVCLVGIGNESLGDDGLGVRLAERVAFPLATRGSGMEIVLAGTDPERHLRFLAAGGFDHIVFLDAVDCGRAPGTVVLLAAAEIKARFLPISTHKISLGVLAEYLEGEGGAKVWLLGVQPAGLKPGRSLSPAARTALEALAGIISEIVGEPRSQADGDPRPARTSLMEMPC